MFVDEYIYIYIEGFLSMYKLKLYNVDSVLVFYCESDTVQEMFYLYDVFMKDNPAKYERATIFADGQHWITTPLLERLKQVIMLF